MAFWNISSLLFIQGNIANAISTIQANKATEEGIAAAQGVRARWIISYIQKVL